MDAMVVDGRAAEEERISADLRKIRETVDLVADGNRISISLAADLLVRLMRPDNVMDVVRLMPPDLRRDFLGFARETWLKHEGPMLHMGGGDPVPDSCFEALRAWYWFSPEELALAERLRLSIGFDDDDEDKHQYKHVCWPFSTYEGALCGSPRLWFYGNGVAEYGGVDCRDCGRELAALVRRERGWRSDAADDAADDGGVDGGSGAQPGSAGRSSGVDGGSGAQPGSAGRSSGVDGGSGAQPGSAGRSSGVDGVLTLFGPVVDAGDVLSGVWHAADNCVSVAGMSDEDFESVRDAFGTPLHDLEAALSRVGDLEVHLAAARSLSEAVRRERELRDHGASAGRDPVDHEPRAHAGASPGQAGLRPGPPRTSVDQILTMSERLAAWVEVLADVWHRSRAFVSFAREVEARPDARDVPSDALAWLERSSAVAEEHHAREAGARADRKAEAEDLARGRP
jgi:hypothetical protein